MTTPAMTTPAVPLTAWGKLRFLEQDVVEARRHVEKLEGEHREASGRAERARGPLAVYYEAVGAADRDADPVLERKLLDDVRAAGESIVMRPRHDRDGAVLSLEAVDTRTEALVAGARRAAAKRESLLAAYRRHAFRELAAELTAGAQEATAHLQATYEAFDQAHDVYRALRNRWMALMGWQGLEADLPDDPLRDAAGDAAVGAIRVPLPVPISLTGRPEATATPEVMPSQPAPGLWSGEGG
jgi:hypothetical protein